MDKITKFPARLKVTPSADATIVGTDYAGNYYGYTHSDSSSHNSEPPYYDRFAAIWDRNGKCLFTAANTNSEEARARRTLIPNKSEAQKQYEKLTSDQRGILAALTNTDHALARNYLKETLKVDVNLDDVIIYARKKEFKA